jgi:hypothetical protein
MLPDALLPVILCDVPRGVKPKTGRDDFLLTAFRCRESRAPALEGAPGFPAAAGLAGDARRGGQERPGQRPHGHSRPSQLQRRGRGPRRLQAEASRLLHAGGGALQGRPRRPALRDPQRAQREARRPDWNAWLAEALAVIRATNPARTVVIGPPSWNGIDHRRRREAGPGPIGNSIRISSSTTSTGTAGSSLSSGPSFLDPERIFI